jgi:hypothetical protein
MACLSMLVGSMLEHAYFVDMTREVLFQARSEGCQIAPCRIACSTPMEEGEMKPVANHRSFYFVQ